MEVTPAGTMKELRPAVVYMHEVALLESAVGHALFAAAAVMGSNAMTDAVAAQEHTARRTTA
jgi:hypothetical protein